MAAALARDGGYPDLAATHYLRAGRDAIARGAVHSGAVLVETAVAVAADPEVALTARIALVDARALTGHVERALWEGAEVLVRLAGDSPTTPRVHLSMARAAAAGQLWPVAEQHLTMAGDAADPGVVLALRAAVALGAGQPEQAVDFASRAAAHAEQVGPPQVVCEAYEVLGRVAREHDLDLVLQGVIF